MEGKLGKLVGVRYTEEVIMSNAEGKVAAVIPCFRERAQILRVLESIGDEVDAIFVVDDGCPDKTGAFVEERCDDDRVEVIFGECNRGVGGAVKLGYEYALHAGCEVIVKLDGDGQHDASLIKHMSELILRKECDYAKGNRFFFLESLAQMPRKRVLGNAFLAFVSKFSTGYWSISDPANGFTAISAKVLMRIPLKKVADGYFFESDMLFRLSTLRAKVQDAPMNSLYGHETSYLKGYRELFPFAGKSLVNFLKRIFYTYYLRGMSATSVELPLGVLLTSFGAFFGLHNWIVSSQTGVPASAGTVMLAALPLVTGFQMLIAVLSADMLQEPSQPISPKLSGVRYPNELA